MRTLRVRTSNSALVLKIRNCGGETSALSTEESPSGKPSWEVPGTKKEATENNR